MFWFVFTLLVLILAFFGDERVTKDKTMRFFIRVVLVFVLSYAIALCSQGNDRDNYISFFKTFMNEYRIQDIWNWLGFQSDVMEPGFFLLAFICKNLGLSAVGFLLVVSLITNALSVNIFYKFRYPILVFFLYIVSTYYLQQSNLVRQMLAVSIGLYAMQYLAEKKWKQFLFMVFLAFIVHKTSLVLLLSLPFFFVKENNYKVFTIVLFLLWILSLYYIVFPIPLIQQISNLIIDTRYENYGNELVTLGLSEVHFSIMVNFFVAYFFMFTDKNKNNTYAYLLVIDCVFENLAFNALLLMRLALYFMPVFVFYVPSLIMENKIMIKKQTFAVGTLLQFFVFFYYLRILINSRIINSFSQIGGYIGNLSEIFN